MTDRSASAVGRVLAALAAALALATCTTGSEVDDADAARDAFDEVSEAGEVDSAGWVVVGVTDGDTVDVSGAAGEETVRLVGINTPESGECFADEATSALTELVDGRGVKLIADQSERDQYGRLLRYVEVDGVDAGAELVATGHALARRFEPDTSRADEYAVLQSGAQAARRGLWAPDACGVPSAGNEVAVTIGVQADAPGDDNDNLNGEWVTITNDSSTALDLDGWSLADESASHRYRFDDVELPAGATVTVFTGCGRDRELQLYWCNTNSSVWNNAGDTAFLRDPKGNLVAYEAYGESG